MGVFLGMLVVTLIFYVGVLISFRTTVKKHPYIVYATAGFILLLLFVPLPLAIITIGSAVWVIQDTRKLEIYKYSLGGPTRPATVILICVVLAGIDGLALGPSAWLLWLVPFTWHLANRHMVLDEAVRLKRKYRNTPPSRSKPNPVVDHRPNQSPDTPISQSKIQNGGKIRVMDVVVEDVEVEDESDADSIYPSEPVHHPASPGDGRNSRFSKTEPRNWPKIAKWGAIGIAGIVVIFVAIPLIATSTPPSSNGGWYGGNYQGQQQYASGPVSADATYRFWEEANGIIRSWWQLTSSITNQNGDPDAKFLANMVMLEQAINAINRLSIDNVDQQAIQAIVNIRDCMSRYLQVAYDAAECRQRYGNNYPQHETARLLAALALCGAETITVKDDYAQTARRLSRVYNRRFSGS